MQSHWTWLADGVIGLTCINRLAEELSKCWVHNILLAPPFICLSSLQASCSCWACFILISSILILCSVATSHSSSTMSFSWSVSWTDVVRGKGLALVWSEWASGGNQIWTGYIVYPSRKAAGTLACLHHVLPWFDLRTPIKESFDTTISRL